MSARVKRTLLGIAGPLFSTGGGSATAYSFTGPSLVYKNIPVAFTLTANGTTSASVTPVITGITGTFSPPMINLSDLTPETLIFTPTENGLGLLSGTNTGGLPNPAAIPLNSINGNKGLIVTVCDNSISIKVG